MFISIFYNFDAEMSPREDLYRIYSNITIKVHTNYDIVLTYEENVNIAPMRCVALSAQIPHLAPRVSLARPVSVCVLSAVEFEFLCLLLS